MIPLVVILAAGSCERCHAEQHAQWASSRHASAATNPLFLASWELHQRRSWCLGCHAPLPGQKVAGSSRWELTAAAAEGVGCAACHPAEAAAEGDHPVAHDPALSDSKRCAACHDFDVPKTFGVGEGPMQDTYDEWHASSSGREARGCTACHDHRARGGHDAAWLSEVLRVDVRRSRGAVTATVRARDTGHALPTGDPFRRLMLSVGSAKKRIVVPADGEVQLRFGATDATTWQVTYSHAEAGLEAQEHSMLVSQGAVRED